MKQQTAPPTYEEQDALPIMWIYAGLCAIVGMFALIGFFLDPETTDGFLIRYFRIFLMGIIGYGYWLFPFAMGLLAWVLVSTRREYVSLRATAALLLPLAPKAIASVPPKAMS